uniref:ubiquitinyl hydrolase 1 n=1 Tax=Fundulus heteroclitus TaxID=8078 RepID=A0A3Q2QV78_FUNHE
MSEGAACIHSSCADQVYGDQDMHEVVRKHCMDYLMKNADYFSNYVTEDFTTYINRKRKNNCHGNHIEMQAMAEMYNRPVEVYQYSTEPINTFHGIHQNNDEPIRVSYHRNIHYNSVVNPNKATIGVGLGLPAFKPGVPEPQQNLCYNTLGYRRSKRQTLSARSTRGRRTGRPPTKPSRSRWRLTTGPSTHNKPPSPAGAALILSKPPSPCAPGNPQVPAVTSGGFKASVCVSGLTDWEDDEILASVLAVSQQEYLDSMKHQSAGAAMHREREPSPDSS